jgi:Lipopolysaccharide-assembly
MLSNSGRSDCIAVIQSFGCGQAFRPRRAAPIAAVVLVSCALLCGCAGYRMGTASLYPPDVHTVYVPMFESDSFRRNLGERLTEAVVKEIESKTPFVVVNSPNADSILTGRLTNETKRLLIEGPTREGRELQLDFRVDVTWIDRKGEIVQPMQAVPLPSTLVSVGQTADIVPEVGQSIATGQQQAIQRVAEQIVSLMEAPW